MRKRVFREWRGSTSQFPVAIARGKHLFPFRTEQLSPAAPMVLGTQVPGRVGRRRFFIHEPPDGRLVFVKRRVGAPALVGAPARRLRTGLEPAAPTPRPCEVRTRRQARSTGSWNAAIDRFATHS